LAEAKPRRVAISALVGGKPLREMASEISPKISSWRAVSLGFAVFVSML
jgi:hypothetical protein